MTRRELNLTKTLKRRKKPRCARTWYISASASSVTIAHSLTSSMSCKRKNTCRAITWQSCANSSMTPMLATATMERGASFCTPFTIEGNLLATWKAFTKEPGSRCSDRNRSVKHKEPTLFGWTSLKAKVAEPPRPDLIASCKSTIRKNSKSNWTSKRNYRNIRNNNRWTSTLINKRWNKRTTMSSKWDNQSSRAELSIRIRMNIDIQFTDSSIKWWDQMPPKNVHEG